MKFAGFAGIALGLAVAGSVWAHSGATGIVKERMDGMMVMGKAVKEITPMMRGKVDYDAEAVRAFAETLGEHSGAAMTRLFPEGTGGAPSVAKPKVWTNWEGFEALAMQLQTLSEGLALAADNGVKGSGPATGGMVDGDSMMGGSSMMGGDSMMGGSGMMGAGPAMNDLGPEELSEMPADAVFRMVSQTCASCHTKFRAEK